MGKFSSSIVLSQIGVTIVGILLVLGGRIEYAGDYLTRKDLEDFGLPVKEWRPNRSFPWGRMIFRVSADIKGVPIYVFAEIEAGAEPGDYDDELKREQVRHEKNLRFTGYHDMKYLEDEAKGFIIKQRIAEEDRYRVLTELHFFRSGHLVLIRVTRTDVAQADVEGALGMTEVRVMAIYRLIRSRCR